MLLLGASGVNRTGAVSTSVRSRNKFSCKANEDYPTVNVEGIIFHCGNRLLLFHTLWYNSPDSGLSRLLFLFIDTPTSYVYLIPSLSLHSALDPS